MRLSVPYHSQEAQDAKHFNNDCGAACASMIIEWAGLGRLSIDALAIQTYLKSNDSQVMSPFWVQALLTNNGIQCELKTGLNADAILTHIDKTGCPAVAFVFWGDLPNRPAFPDWYSGHYVTVNGSEAGAVFINDPDFWGSHKEQGKNLRVTRDDLNTALNRSNLQGVSILVTARPNTAHAVTTAQNAAQNVNAGQQNLFPDIPRQVPVGEALVAVDSLWLRAAPAGAQVKLLNLGDRLIIQNIPPVVAALNGNAIPWVSVLIEGIGDGWCAEGGLTASVNPLARGG